MAGPRTPLRLAARPAKMPAEQRSGQAGTRSRPSFLPGVAQVPGDPAYPGTPTESGPPANRPSRAAVSQASHLSEPADKGLSARGDGAVEGWSDLVDVALVGPLG